jgi:hypothetical protein
VEDRNIQFRQGEAVKVAVYHQDHTADHLHHQTIQVLQDLNPEAHIRADPLHTHPDLPDHHRHSRRVHHQGLLHTAVHPVHHREEDRL